MLKKDKTMKLIAILIVMVMSMCALSGCGNNQNGKEEKNKESTEDAAIELPIKNMVEGLLETNSEKFISAFPPFYSGSLGELFNNEALKTALDTSTEEYGENIKMTYEITNKTQIEESKIEEMEKEVKESYNQDVDITKGYELEVKITTKGDKAEDTETDAFEIYQIDGNYYLLNI